MVESAHDGGRGSGSSEFAEEVETLLCFLGQCCSVVSPGEVLCDVHTQKLGAEIRGECHGHIHIKCDREPEMNSPMMLKCFIKNTDDSLHTGCSKRPMSGNLRVQIYKELCEGRMESHVWRASEATKLMDFGDPEPSHLPNLATLRKAKQERNALEQWFSKCGTRTTSGT